MFIAVIPEKHLQWDEFQRTYTGDLSTLEAFGPFHGTVLVATPTKDIVFTRASVHYHPESGELCYVEWVSADRRHLTISNE